MSYRLVTCLFVLVAAVPASLHAQTFSTGVVSGWGAPNADRSTGVELAIESSRMPFRAILALERGGRTGFGVPCEPEIAQFCEPEPLEHSTSMVTLGIGWSFGLLDDGRWRAGLGPELFLTRLGGSTRGEDSDREVSTNTIMQGGGAALDVMWLPSAGSAWSVRLRTGVRARLALLNVECDDCYDPFDESFATRELALSVGYRFND